MYGNSVTIVGNITKNGVEVRSTNSGKSVANFTISFSQGKDADKGFLDVTVWEDLADNAAESFQPGTRVMVTGVLRHETWEANDGTKRSRLKVVAEDVAASVRWNTVTSHVEPRWQGPSDDEELL